MMDTSKEFLSFYKHPFLAADRIELRHGTDAIVLYQGKRELELTINGDIEGARATLQDLCDPNSDTWQRVRTEMQDGLAELLDKLDRLGWLCDADQGGHKKIADERERLSNLHTRTVQWLLTPVSTAAGIEESELNWRQRYQASAANFASEAKALWLARKQDQLTVTVQPAMFAEGNLAAEGLSLLLRAWQRTSPLALQLVASVFSSVSAQLSSYMSDELEPLDSLATTMSDAEEVSKQVWAAAVLLILSASANRNARYSAFIPEENLEGSGLSVLVRAEIAAEKLLSALGRSPLLRLLERGRPARRVAIAVYLHQYFTTIRYIEAVISFL
ncbi:MAG TPA: hypothetical protein VKB86_11215, partial [Pyrinomonadaceae bacterium]|nr:hypothetical protein [Pyrinomonadaceae bacterium]